jgi:hypothetical protein
MSSSMEEEDQQHVVPSDEAARAHALRVLAKRPLERIADEVESLAAHLQAGSPFFSSMRPDVLNHLCTLVGESPLRQRSVCWTRRRYCKR